MSVVPRSDNNHTDLSFKNLDFDDKTFEIFFKEYFAPLCAYCQYKFNLDIEEAKEIVHIGFIKLWETRDVITPNLSAKAYLYKIITNCCLDKLRHYKVKLKYERHFLLKAQSNASEKSFNLNDQKQVMQIIDTTISDMPEQMRKIFELSRYEGFKYAQIADTLNISVKTVETQISRALVRLRDKLSDYLVVILFSAIIYQ
jgi:RNA polymerase sigma-70 factor, ECF subfamily